jgi:hypothetical protein
MRVEMKSHFTEQRVTRTDESTSRSRYIRVVRSHVVRNRLCSVFPCPERVAKRMFFNKKKKKKKPVRYCCKILFISDPKIQYARRCRLLEIPRRDRGLLLCSVRVQLGRPYNKYNVQTDLGSLRTRKL